VTSSDSRGGGQEQVARRSEETEQEPPVEASADVAERKAALDEDVDALLDEIDDVLEQNSEEFVKSFVQKGGE
jgi:ubiquitin-like protein Pup